MKYSYKEKIIKNSISFEKTPRNSRTQLGALVFWQNLKTLDVICVFEPHEHLRPLDPRSATYRGSKKSQTYLSYLSTSVYAC